MQTGTNLHHQNIAEHTEANVMIERVGECRPHLNNDVSGMLSCFERTSCSSSLNHLSSQCGNKVDEMLMEDSGSF